MENKDELMHYGVMGMRWGKRKVTGTVSGKDRSKIEDLITYRSDNKISKGPRMMKLNRKNSSKMNTSLEKMLHQRLTSVQKQMGKLEDKYGGYNDRMTVKDKNEYDGLINENTRALEDIGDFYNNSGMKKNYLRKATKAYRRDYRR